MFSRRRFISVGLYGALCGGMWNKACANEGEQKYGSSPNQDIQLPFVIATWKNVEAVKTAGDILASGGYALDAVEAGVKTVEANPQDSSVGYGGRPDRDGNVTLDACIMNEKGDCGSVCYLKNIKHPISVARKVMEETPHVILAGEGAQAFALEKGFKKENLLTESSKEAWEEWKKVAKYKPIINIENHDTIGMLAIDQDGDICGACTTSGLAYKLAGRVGDSPIIGAGLFVDNEVGGAVATGMGEAVLKSLGSFLIVEFMRQGKSPQEACEATIKRIAGKMDVSEFQVGFLAIDKKGNTGAYSVHPEFLYTVHTNKKETIYDAGSLLKK